MVEYPVQDFEVREEEKGYNLSYEISRLIRDYEVVSIIITEARYSTGSELAQMMYQLGFETEPIEKAEARIYDEDLDASDDEFQSIRQDAIVEAGEKTQQRIRKRLRELGVTYPSDE